MRRFNVTVNGKTYSVDVEETGIEGPQPVPVMSQPASVPAPAVAASAPAGGKEVKSPLPGLILELAFSNGSMVKKGDKIAVLEAMKMENDIQANADGKITYAVKKGDTIETEAVVAYIN